MRIHGDARVLVQHRHIHEGVEHDKASSQFLDHPHQGAGKPLKHEASELVDRNDRAVQAGTAPKMYVQVVWGKAFPLSAPSAPTAESVTQDPLESREEGGGRLRKLGNVLAVIAAIVAGLFVLGLYSPGAAAAAFVLLILLFIIATPILGWLLLLWLCRWAGRFLAGDDKALASMIGTGLFVTLLISGLLTSCMLQSQIANGLSRAMMTAAERNADTQERFSPNRTVHGPGNAPVARLRSVP